MKRFADTNLLVALLGAVLVVATRVLLGLPATGFYLPLFVAAGVFLVYHIDRALVDAPEDRVNRPDRSAYFDVRPWLVLGAPWIALAILAWSAWHLPVAITLVSAPLGVAGLLHGVTFKSGRRLKALPNLKPVLVALAWAVVVVILPWLEARMGPDVRLVLLLMGYRALLFAANVLVSDISDVAGDRSAGLRTLAVRLGASRTSAVAGVLCLLALAPGLWAGYSSGMPWLFVVDGAGALILGGAAFLAGNEDRPVPGYVVDYLLAWPIVTIAVALFMR